MYLTIRALRDGYAIMASVFFFAVDHRTPLCQGRCCMAPGAGLPNEDDGLFWGICRLAPEMLLDRDEPRNFFDLATAPQPGFI